MGEPVGLAQMHMLCAHQLTMKACLPCSPNVYSGQHAAQAVKAPSETSLSSPHRALGAIACWQGTAAAAGSLEALPCLTCCGCCCCSVDGCGAGLVWPTAPQHARTGLVGWYCRDGGRLGRKRQQQMADNSSMAPLSSVRSCAEVCIVNFIVNKVERGRESINSMVPMTAVNDPPMATGINTHVV